MMMTTEEVMMTTEDDNRMTGVEQQVVPSRISAFRETTPKMQNVLRPPRPPGPT